MRQHSREPIRHTCPDIDSVIRTVDSVVSDLSGLEKELEKLRSSNDELRTWGIEEALEVDRLESENEELKDTIKDLYSEIAKLKLQEFYQTELQ